MNLFHTFAAHCMYILNFRNDRDILIAFYTYQYQNSSQYHLRNFQLLLVKIKCDSF
jgi:hypothetical protein